MTNEYSQKDVAEFMKSELEKKREIFQEDIVYQIKRRFGDEFVYINQNGNLALSKKVLAEFRKITPDLVWVRSDRYWRFRQDYDDPATRFQE